MSCSHVNTQITITREARFEKCDDCGAQRETFVVESLLKEGAALAFRTADFRADGTKTLRALVELSTK